MAGATERSEQTPEPGKLNLDHVAHFVADAKEAADDLTRLGFTLTPFSPQSHRLEPGGPLVPAGTGNRCVMFQRGYLEFLTPTGDTPLADQLRAAMSRYIGVHLIAFGTAAPELDHERLSTQGFDPLPPVALERPISTETGEDTARFCVVRVPPGTMPEGRIQYCQQRTAHLVWQRRWTSHPNGVTELAAVIICVADAAEATERYARFAGLRVERASGAWRMETQRGTLIFVEPDALSATLDITPPDLPWIAGYALKAPDLNPIRSLARGAHASVMNLTQDRLLLRYSGSLGGIALIETPSAKPLRFDA